MKAIVTGGAGFIGSHLVELLIAEGHEVTVIDNFSGGRIENLDTVKDSPLLNVCYFDIVKLNNGNVNKVLGMFRGVDCVFHLAGKGDIVPSIESPLDYFRVNVDGTMNLMEVCRKAGVKKVVYAASSSCYGVPRKLPITEESEIRPEYPYALTKRLGEELVLHWGKVYGIDTVSLRIMHAYGMRQKTRGAYGSVFGVFLAQKLNEMPFTIVGDGTQTRDFVHVRDVARAFLMAWESDVSGEIFNLGGEDPQTVNKIAELIGGKDYPRVHLPKRPREPEHDVADITKIKTFLGWEPRIEFNIGVKEMVENIGYWKDAPLWDRMGVEKATAGWFKFLS